MELLTALIIDLVVIAVLFEVARRANLPYPALFVLGGLALGFIPGLPSITLEPELVLVVFLPPLLFVAAFETPLRDLRRNLGPIARLAIVLVVFTTVVVAAVAQALVPGMGWAAAFALGAIVAPTDALAATSVFRRLGVPRIAITLIEGESLFNDATALIAYRAAVVATVTGVFVLTDTLADVPRRGRRRDRARLDHRPGDGRGRALARRPARRGRRLPAGPVGRLPAGGAIRTVRGARRRDRSGW